MLQIKTFIAADNYGGQGLFTDEDVPKGGLILRYCPEFTRYIPLEEYYEASCEEQELWHTHAYPHYEPNANPPMLGLMLNLDDARYCNHSDDPNTMIDAHDQNLCLASRAIKKGEEITCNYLEFDPDDVIAGRGIPTCKDFLRA